MNIHADPRQFSEAPEAHDDYAAEQSVIARVLVRPEMIDEVSSALRPADFVHPFHARLMADLFALSAEGRKPSLQAILAIAGSGEIEPGLTTRDYLTRLVAQHEVLVPLADAIETVRDHAQRRALASLGSLLVSRSSQQGMSVADIAGYAVQDLDDVLAAVRTGRRRSYDAQGAVDMALDHYASDGRKYPPTGLADLDRLLGGWPLGQLSIVAGRPGMGKSALASRFVLSAASQGFGVVFFSLEMRGEQLGSRISTDIAYQADDPINYRDILARNAMPDRHMRRLVSARDSLAGWPVHFDEQSGLTLAEMVAASRKAATRFERQGRTLSMVVVDHMGLVTPSGRYRGNRVNEITELTAGLAVLAKELDVAVVALSQLNRAVEGRENKRAGLSDLRDSGSIEQDASVVVFAYRPAYYFERRENDADKERERLANLEQCRHKLELNVAKNRNGGTGIIDCFVDIGANAIRNAARERDE